GHDASPVLEPVGSLTTYLAGSDQETLLFNTVRLISYCGVFRGNYCLNRQAVLDSLEKQAKATVGRDRAFLAEHAWQEIEVWLLAGHVLPRKWAWRAIRD